MRIADLHLRSDHEKYVLHKELEIGSGASSTCYKIRSATAKGGFLAVKKFHAFMDPPVSEEDAIMCSDIDTRTYVFPGGRLYIDQCRDGSLTGLSAYSGLLCPFANGTRLDKKNPFIIKFETLFKASSVIRSDTKPVSERRLLVYDNDLGNILYSGNNFVHIDTIGFEKLDTTVSSDDVQKRNMKAWSSLLANFLIQGFMIPFVSGNSELSSRVQFGERLRPNGVFGPYISKCSFDEPEEVVGLIKEELSRSCGQSVESIGEAKKILGGKKILI